MQADAPWVECHTFCPESGITRVTCVMPFTLLFGVKTTDVALFKKPATFLEKNIADPRDTG